MNKNQYNRLTQLIVESAQDKRVQNFLKQHGYSDYNKRMEIIGALKHDIPNIRLDNNKFLLGCLRMFLDGELRDEQSIRNIDKALKYIHAGNHTEEYSEDLNGLSAMELNETFREAARDLSNNDRERSSKQTFTGGSDYKIIPINSYEEAKPYGKYTSWCVTHGNDAFKMYTRGGNRFYFCLKNGFENVPQNDEGAPINEYGLSMIAVNVDMEGNLTRVTTRYNHDFDGENNPELETTEQLEKVLNVPFYQTFKPYSRQELLDMGIVPFDMVQELLDSGKDPEDIFDSVINSDIFTKVSINDKWNLLSDDNKILSPIWFDWCSNFIKGWAKVDLNSKQNFINQQGKLMFPDQWMYCVSDFDDGQNAFVSIEEGKQNFVDTNGKLMSPIWFKNMSVFRDGISVVNKDRKTNLINRKGKLFFPDMWFDSVEREYIERNRDHLVYKVYLNGYVNIVDKGKLVFEKWFDYISNFGFNLLAEVKMDGKFNWINSKLQIVSPNMWFDSVGRFRRVDSDNYIAPVKIDDMFNIIQTDGYSKGKLLSPNRWLPNFNCWNATPQQLISFFTENKQYKNINLTESQLHRIIKKYL
jgi:hypothetical protein